MSNLELFQKIDELVTKAPENRHSYYQLKHFVIGKQPTIQAQLWQCLIELQSRKETIENIQLQIDDLKDDLALLELERIDVDGSFEMNEIRLRKAKRKKESFDRHINKLEKQLEFAVQEARFFVQAFEALEVVEKVKDFDDLESQKELWEAKVSEEINLKLLFRQPLSPDTLKTALSLHQDSKVKGEVLNMLQTMERVNAKMIKGE